MQAGYLQVVWDSSSPNGLRSAVTAKLTVMPCAFMSLSR